MVQQILNPIELEYLFFGNKINFANLPSKLIHIFGEAGAGKTTLALQIACNFCLGGEKVVFIDTEGKATGMKIKEMLQGKNFSKINSRLKLYRPDNFQKQFELIRDFEFYIKTQKIGLLIIDTITNLYRQEIHNLNNDKAIFRKLAYQVASLKFFAERESFPVILFNQATMKTKNEEKEDVLTELKSERVQPVAKGILNYWADREIILVSHGFGEFEARIPGEFEGRVKFSMNANGIIPLEKTVSEKNE